MKTLCYLQWRWIVMFLQCFDNVSKRSVFWFLWCQQIAQGRICVGSNLSQKNSTFSICNCEIGFLFTLACFFHDIICHEEHFHSFHIGTKSLSLRAEFANTTKQSDSRHFDSTCSNFDQVASVENELFSSHRENQNFTGFLMRLRACRESRPRRQNVTY